MTSLGGCGSGPQSAGFCLKPDCIKAQHFVVKRDLRVLMNGTEQPNTDSLDEMERSMAVGGFVSLCEGNTPVAAVLEYRRAHSSKGKKRVRSSALA